MAKNTKESNSAPIKNVESTLTTTEQFLESHYKELLIGLGVVVLLIGIFWVGRIYLGKQDDEAKSQMYQAEKYFEMDSLNLALNGDGNYLGFIDIANDYKYTNSGNLARYNAGLCYLHLGQYEDAIDYLGKYKRKDKLIASLAIGATGDAYVELGDVEKGISLYLEAADFGDNSFNTPIFLMKAAELHELNNNYEKALELYERIQKEYPESTEGMSIEKYIARVKLLMK